MAGPLLSEGGTSRRKWVVIALAAMVGLYVLGTFIEVWWASRADYQSGTVRETTTAAVVLGAAQYNGEPSPVLRARLDESVELYSTGDVELVVVTGGGQENDITTEAKTGYDYLREAGIPDEHIRLEVQGGSTYESLAATARFLRNEEVTEVVLVTDRYHARRATLTAEEVGLDPSVSLTPQRASIDRLVHETGGVAVGRLISFRRLDRLS